MGGSFWWVFDLVVVLILLFCILNGARKGFSKIIVSAIGCAASFAIALTISKYSAGIIYDKMFRQSNIKAVETAIEDYNPEDVIKTIIEKNELSGILSNENVKTILEGQNSLDMLYEYANSRASNILDSKENFKNNIVDEFAKAFSSQVGANLPPYVAQEMLKHFVGNEEMFLKSVELLLNDPDKLPPYIEENYIREPAIKITECAVFLIVFFVLMTVIILVANRSSRFGLLNGYDRLDRFAGGVMGAIEGIAAVIVVVFIVMIIINMSEKDDSFVSLNTIENTKIFKHFYNNLAQISSR